MSAIASSPGDSLAAVANPSPGHLHWPSVIQCVTSALGVLVLWGGAAMLVMVALMQRLSEASQPFEEVPLLMLAAGMFGCGALLLISAGYALLRLTGNQPVQLPAWLTRLRPTLLIFAFPLVLLAGFWVSQISALAWLLLPGLHVLAVGLPVLWLAYLGLHGLPRGSPQRIWGLVSSGAVLGPGIILVVEVGVIGLAILALAIYLAFQPALAAELSELAQNLTLTPETQAELLDQAGAYLGQPLAIFGILAFGAVVIPLVEELFKPLGVWLLVGKQLTPAEGLAAGVLSGAGYALFESLVLGSQVQAWAEVTFARIGTALIHICATGLVGWALASAWGQKKYFQLGAAYLLAVSIHGLWNGLTLLNGVVPVAVEYGGLSADSFLGRLAFVAPVGLVVLALGALVVLMKMNRAMQPAEVQSELPGANVV